MLHSQNFNLASHLKEHFISVTIVEKYKMSHCNIECSNFLQIIDKKKIVLRTLLLIFPSNVRTTLMHFS